MQDGCIDRSINTSVNMLIDTSINTLLRFNNDLRQGKINGCSRDAPEKSKGPTYQVLSLTIHSICPPNQFSFFPPSILYMLLCSSFMPLCSLLYIPHFCCPAVGERIMEFVQCNADVKELVQVRQHRDERASLRAEGLKLTRALVAAAASAPAKVLVWVCICICVCVSV